LQYSKVLYICITKASSMTTTEAKRILTENKIGKGCKISYVSNKVFINYSIGKFLNGSFAKDVQAVKESFAGMQLNISRLGNTGGINIWL